jgi:hypothetical protein
MATTSKETLQENCLDEPEDGTWKSTLARSGDSGKGYFSYVQAYSQRFK